MGIDDEDLRNEILIAGLHPGASLAATALRPVGGEWHPLHISLVADGEHHILALDQILDIMLELIFLDQRPAGNGIFLLHLQHFIADDADQARSTGKNIEIIENFFAKVLKLVADFILAKRRQALQTQIKNRAGLRFRQAISAILSDHIFRIINQSDQWRNCLCLPVAGHQLGARRRRIGRPADQGNHLVDIGNGNGEADQHMRPLPRLAEQIFRPPGDDLLAEIKEGFKKLLDVQQFRLTPVEGKHVDAEGGLQRSKAVKLVQHHFRHGLALDFDDDAHAMPVGLIAQIAHALNLLGPHQIGNLLNQPRLVDLVGDFTDDQRLTIFADFLHIDLGAHDDGTPPRGQPADGAAAPQNDTAGGKIRARNIVDQLLYRHFRLLKKRERAINHLAEVMRRNVRGHADGDATCAIDQQVRIARRQNGWFALAIIIVVNEIDRFLVDIINQAFRRLFQPRFGVSHSGGLVAIHGTEVTLPLNQGEAHGEILRKAHHRIVNRAVAMRMIATHHVTDDAGRFAERLVGGIAVFIHRVDDAPVHRLQPIARIGQRARHNHAHGIVEIRPPHFLFDSDRNDMFVSRRLGYFAQGRLPE